MARDFERQLSGVAALADQVRRRVYEHVVAQRDAVSRDGAAEACGIKRSLAAFHLDKLVDEGLLQVEYRRLTGRTGPGAGRPSKLYRRADAQFAVTLPPRGYDLAGRILAGGIAQAAASGTDVIAATNEVAYQHGRSLAAPAVGDPLDAITAVLTDHGYEPRVEDDRIMLANCPFHTLAQEFRQLVCGMNLALCRGLAAGSGADTAGLAARLNPEDGRCCVTFEKTA